MSDRKRKAIIDISVPLVWGMPLWPGSDEFRLTQVQSIEWGDPANVSKLECEVHTGTHLDAPRHFLEKGITVDRFPLDILVGSAIVAFFPGAQSITAHELESANLPFGTKRLLLKTSNSDLWAKGDNEFKRDYVGLTSDGAEWIVEHGLQLVGIDYLSIASYQDTATVHRILLGAELVVLEGLDLSQVGPGEYELICLPLKLIGAEGGPARVILRTF